MPDCEMKYSDIKVDDVWIFEMSYLGKSYAVDLKTGEFHLNGKTLRFDGYKELNYELIYFIRRHALVGVGPGALENHGVISYPVIGWRTRVGNAEVKRMIKIHPDGSYSILEK
jgi:hypothetical protein